MDTTPVLPLESTMTRDELKKILPHREPMLLIDEVTLIDSVAHGSLKIHGDEFFLQGHFPDNPVVPGVILCEILGQSACVLIPDLLEGKTPYFVGIKEAKFRHPVKPGDTFTTEVSIDQIRRQFVYVKATGYVDGKKCVEASLSFTAL